MKAVHAATVVEVSNLTKEYRQGEGLGYWLGRAMGMKDVSGVQQAGNRVVRALAAVSFDVKAGEAFGIIGRNGAGKSTLLQILAGTLQPSSGTARIQGRVTALLELGSGFNPEFSGRENVYLAGSILGISRKEMDAKLEEIETFADVGDFIHQPVKTYSTGMMMRVAFAVAVSVQPDVLIIDEALSVGDILFQQKCNRRLRELLAKGVTLLVVTHDTAFVLNLCHRAIWLNKGQVAFLGDASTCVREYLTAMSASAGNEVCLSASTSDLPVASTPLAEPLFLDDKERTGDGGISVAKAWIQNEAGEATTVFRMGEWVRVTLLLRAEREVRMASGGCELRNRLGQVIFAMGLRASNRVMESIPAGEGRLVIMRFKADLAVAQYTIELGCGAGEQSDNTWQRIPGAVVIEIAAVPGQDVVHGLVRLPHDVGAYCL